MFKKHIRNGLLLILVLSLPALFQNCGKKDSGSGAGPLDSLDIDPPPDELCSSPVERVWINGKAYCIDTTLTQAEYDDLEQKSIDRKVAANPLCKFDFAVTDAPFSSAPVNLSGGDARFILNGDPKSFTNALNLIIAEDILSFINPTVAVDNITNLKVEDGLYKYIQATNTMNAEIKGLIAKVKIQATNVSFANSSIKSASVSAPTVLFQTSGISSGCIKTNITDGAPDNFPEQKYFSILQALSADAKNSIIPSMSIPAKVLIDGFKIQNASVGVSKTTSIVSDTNIVKLTGEVGDLVLLKKSSITNVIIKEDLHAVSCPNEMARTIYLLAGSKIDTFKNYLDKPVAIESTTYNGIPAIRIRQTEPRTREYTYAPNINRWRDLYGGGSMPADRCPIPIP